MTSHVLFVGFGFRDEDFEQTRKSVEAVLPSVEASGGRRKSLGTALALLSDEAAHFPQGIEALAMVQAGDAQRYPEAARLLEIFLDRVAYAATGGSRSSAEYLLDPHYRSGAGAQNEQLIEALLRVEDALPGRSREDTGAATRVRQVLRELGLPDVPRAARAEGRG